MQTKQLRLGDILVETGCISESQLKEALELQKNSFEKRRLGEVLVEGGFAAENNINSALATRLGINYVSMNDTQVDIEAVKKIPKSISLKHNLIAVAIRGNNLVINISDPLNYYALEDVRLISHMQVEVQVCDRAEIRNAINAYYAEIETQKAAVGANESAERIAALGYVDIAESADDTPIVTLLNSTLHKAHTAGASDLHIEPFEENTLFRIRVDGLIVDYLTVPVSLHNSIVARIKILAGMDIAEKRAPQDGHFRAKLQELDLNVRVSSLPTVYGEKVVLRFMGQLASLDNADSFGMPPDDYKKMQEILQIPHGVIYVTGPTGSGKTTTLYMIMERLSRRNVNIATVEDPVERNLARINQSQVNPIAGLTFATALRSILRQDPDIVMIGETRDTETAQIGVRAALTGHLVVSSLHTNDAIAAIVRLMDMGVEEYLLANTLAGIVAQRLVKKNCQFCLTEYEPSQWELQFLGGYRPEKLAKGAGCHVCNNTGYKGRTAVHEILTIDEIIRSMITSRAAAKDIYAYVRETGNIKFLRESLLQLVLQKVTTVDELVKLTYSV